MTKKKQELLSPKQIIEAWREPILSVPSVRDYNGNEFLNSFMLAAAENEKLITALTEPKSQPSVINALKRAATTGLSLNPQEAKAGIIPYWNSNKKCYDVGYQVFKNGLIELAMETGQVEMIDSDTVFYGDEFEIFKTMNGDEFKHVPALEDRGEIKGFYAYIKLKTGICKVSWMTTAQVEKHAETYGGSLKEGSAWNKSFPGMGEKTVLKKRLTSTHLSVARTAVNIDNQEDARLIDIEVVNVTESAKVETKGATGDDISEKIASEKQDGPEHGIGEDGIPF